MPSWATSTTEWAVDPYVPELVTRKHYGEHAGAKVSMTECRPAPAGRRFGALRVIERGPGCPGWCQQHANVAVGSCEIEDGPAQHWRDLLAGDIVISSQQVDGEVPEMLLPEGDGALSTSAAADLILALKYATELAEAARQ